MINEITKAPQSMKSARSVQIHDADKKEMHGIIEELNEVLAA